MIPALFRIRSPSERTQDRRGIGALTRCVILRALTGGLSLGAAETGDSSRPALLRWTLPEAGAMLVPFVPPKESGTGCAVLIVPGSEASLDRETQLAKWLSAQGIAGFILRPGPQTADPTASETALNQAVRYLRAQSAALGMSTRRLGILGFGRGAEQAAAMAFPRDAVAGPPPTDAADQTSARPDFLALIGGAVWPAAGKNSPPPTFLAGSARASDGMSGMIELWGRLRAAQVPVDAHFFARADAASGLAPGQPSLGPWPEMLHGWLRASGFLTTAPRVAIKGMAFLDGQPLAHGYVIFTPLAGAGPGTGPVIGRVLNSTVGVPIGEFSLPAEQGPVAGRYRVDVRQNMTRWLSNAFSGDLVNARGAPTPAQAYFGHHRRLEPSIDDQHSYSRVHPTDREEATIEFLPGADANLRLKIEVFSH